MRILSGALLAGAACLSILTGCGASGDETPGDEAGGLDPELKDFQGTWKDDRSGIELSVTGSGKATVTGWGEEDELTGSLVADNADGVASFDATGDGKKGESFHFLVEFQDGKADHVYLDDTNETDVPPLDLRKQG